MASLTLDDIDIFDKAHTAHIKLDHSRHVGKVFPPENGAHFAQDGLLFDAHGNLAVSAMDEDAHKRLKRSIVKKHADIEAEKARRAVYDQLGIQESDLEDASKAKNIVAALAAPAADGELDVLAWARGEIRAEWFKVRAAAQRQFGFAVDDKRHLLDRLVEEKRLKVDEIKV